MARTIAARIQRKLTAKPLPKRIATSSSTRSNASIVFISFLPRLPGGLPAHGPNDRPDQAVRGRRRVRGALRRSELSADACVFRGQRIRLGDPVLLLLSCRYKRMLLL